jgi:hypothetical protein
MIVVRWIPGSRQAGAPRNDDVYEFPPSLRAQAKQSMSRQAEAWIASSLSLPAMTLMRRIPE